MTSSLSDPTHKAWLSVYRDHWWGEVVNDIDAIIETMSRGLITYTFDGHPFMTADRNLHSVNDRAAVRTMYRNVVSLGIRLAG
ncbi:MAG: hypothetical protein HC869_21675, partial [Rhodospirillales bacterium]|nr:hypothetical protein [Rhodospirillales bacterium]